MFANKFNKMKSVRGVGEWAGYSYNCGIGCSHGCRYCYSASFFAKEGIIASRDAWAIEKPNARKVQIFEMVDQAIQFPSSHDISPAYLEVYCRTLNNILESGNRVLLVSKPHLECIEHICREFRRFSTQMELRFTIGSIDPDLTQYWEPGAPLPEERLRSLVHATEQGYQTSVSMEPILAGRTDALATFREVEPLTNGTVWIGMMNELDERMLCATEADREARELISQLQAEEEMIMLYQDLNHEPKVRWKDSFKDLVKNL